jgi:hypothetical protein
MNTRVLNHINSRLSLCPLQAESLSILMRAGSRSGVAGARARPYQADVTHRLFAVPVSATKI